MSDISNQLIKDSYNYVLQSDLSTGVVYRIGGGIPVNPKFLSGLTINSGFTYSNGTEQPGYVLITDAFGNANWGPISGSSNGNYLSLSGGTVTGPTNFTGGLTSNTFSAETYYNLPVSGVTGGTGISAGTTNGLVTIVNTTPDQIVTLSGGTNIGINGTYPNFGINFTGSTGVSGDFLPLSGGTVTGGTTFTSGLTANTISATTYYNLPTDVFVTGGTYTSGNVIFTNNTGGTFNVSGFAVGSGGGQIFYLNLSQSQGSNRLLSTTASTASEQSTGVTINNGVTGTIASFQSQPLNTTLLPGGIWSFYLHSYKENTNASFNIFVEVYKRTSGGTQTLLFTTDPTPVTTNSPNPSMQLSDGYFSGTSLSVSDGVVAVVRATNTDNQPHIITLVTEGSTHYSYVVSTIPTQQGLTCDTLSGCSIIQTIQTDVSNKLDKSGGTITGNLIINSGLTANTISATTYQNLPTDIRVTGGTYSNGTATFTNNTGETFNVTGFTTPFTGGTVTGATNFTGGLTANTISATTYQGINRSFGVSFDGMGSVILVNSQSTLTIPYNMVIQSWVLLSDVSGSTVIDIWKDTYTNYPPTSGDSITALAKPSIVSGTKNQSSTLTGWNPIVNSGDIITFNVNSCTGMTKAQLTIIGKEF